MEYVNVKYFFDGWRAEGGLLFAVASRSFGALTGAVDIVRWYFDGGKGGRKNARQGA